MQSFVSILVPAYNVAPYIGPLLRQLEHLHGLVPDLELVFVDDGSSDGSLEIIEETALPNARVIRHGSNRGLSAARNSLMDAAHGAYVWFLDGDDLISVVHAAELLKSLREAPAGCLLFDYLRFKQSALPSVHIGTYGPEIAPPEIQVTWHFARSLPPNETVTDRAKFLVPYLLDELHYSWAMIVQRSLLADIRFPENLIFEDQAVTPRLMLAAKSVRYRPVPIVLYRDRSDSLEKQMTYKAAHDAGQAMFSCLAAFEGANLTGPERRAFGVCLLRSLVFKTRRLSKLNEIAKPEAYDMLRSLVGEFKRFIGDQESDVIRLVSKESGVVLKKLLSLTSDPK